MSRLRKTLAERLVQAQHNAALLTTFNEVDMSAVMALRKEFQEGFVVKNDDGFDWSSFGQVAAADGGPVGGSSS